MKHLATIIEDTTTGEQICACCGRVIENNQLSTKLPNYNEPEKIHHQKANTHHHDFSLGSIADIHDKNSKNINKWQSRLRVSNSKESKICVNFKALEKIFASKYTARTIKEIAFHMSRKASKTGLDQGCKIEIFQAVIIYFAYEVSGNKIPRNVFISDFSLNKKTFNKYVWIIKDQFKIISDYEKITEKMLFHHAVNLKLRKNTINLAYTIIENARKKGLVDGKDTGAVIATSLYVASYSTMKVKPRTNQSIANECNTSIQSINNIHRQWHNVLEILELRTQIVRCHKFI